MIIPSHLQIETINGVCTARCTMCAFPTWTRKPYRMKKGEFGTILARFLPYQHHLQYLSLFGFGEPLLDKGLPSKIKQAKEMGFKGIGFATNCTELNYSRARSILEAGLDTIICSVDGITKETHEAIRVGTVFKKVVGNIRGFMNMRPRFGRTKVIIRFIRQKANAHEWEAFKVCWERRLDSAYGDAVISFDVVDCDGKVKDYGSKDVLSTIGLPSTCDQLYERIIILSNGDVALCCADDNGKFNMGNALFDDPIEIYNNETFKRYRRLMEEGRIGYLPLCSTCTIPRSMEAKHEKD